MAFSAASSPIPESSQQLVLVIAEEWTSRSAVLARYERHGKGWKRVGHEIPVVLGATGLAWGIGLHPKRDRDGDPVKREGDLKSPAGAFALGPAYGYAARPYGKLRWPYSPSTPSLRCVDDPEAVLYNQIVPEGKGQWRSAETMRRRDALYRWLVVVLHNSGRAMQRGGGSCIFLHIWSGPKGATAGCTAMAEAALKTLLGWLDVQKQPTLVQLPRQTYHALRESWGLP
jgi:D-alanyl-D-alanine dipeptidase